MTPNPDTVVPVRRRAIQLVMAAVLGFAQLAVAADTTERRYTLFVAVRAPHAENRAALQKMLAQEGYEASTEGDEELVLALTAGELRKLFQARVGVQTVAASASDRMVTQPVLESATIPARFRKLVRRVYFDPQRG